MHLLELDLDNLLEILKSDNLNLLSEEALVDVVRSYIDNRENIKPLKPKSAEELTKPELWALLTEEEKENRNKSLAEE